MKLTFDPLTIQHLGFRMYSQLPNALAELVANSYDADASRVDVQIVESPSPAVIVSDDGHGMSDEEMQSRYLVIGRNRVNEGKEHSESGRRRAAGRKGLGKLAPFGIGNEVTVRTKRAGVRDWTVVTMNWSEMLGSDGDYSPRVEHVPGAIGEHGTSVEVRDLKRKTTIDPSSLARSLARLFNYLDDEFRLFIQRSGRSPIEVVRQLRYESIVEEHRWDVPQDLPTSGFDAANKGVSGVIIASERPLPTHMRGITVYVNGRLANDPEFFGASESSYAAAYLTGHVEANYLDELTEDVIATDRRSISWESQATSDFREYMSAILRAVMRLRRDTRKRAQRERLKRQLNVDPDHWVGTIQGPEREAVAAVLDVLTSPESDIAEGDKVTVVESLRDIAPEYADLHWRHVHPEIQAACEDEYKSGQYYAAAVEAIKSYVKAVEAAISFEQGESKAIDYAFGGADPRVDVMAKWSQIQLGANTPSNIRRAQHGLSGAIWTGFRNPIQHEARKTLQESGIFTYQDCLDAISLVSHLRRRLDGAADQLDSEA